MRQVVKEATYGRFPQVRLRRTRQHDWLRRLVAENSLSVDDLIAPVFVCGQSGQREIPSMPGVTRYSIDELLRYVEELAKLHVPAIHIFPFYDKSERKDNVIEMLNPDNLACQAVRVVKEAFPNIGVITDVALDCYTVHGQDGLVRGGHILNDETVAVISDYAVVQAQIGADVIAPSEMMDGRVGAIRSALDAAGSTSVNIMSYAAKYASSFYGPFRDAVGSKDCLAQADKKTYQMDPANTDEAMREVALDIDEGADMVMVKPGLPYLDILYRLKQQFKMPTFAYHVSGEYATLKFAAAQGALDYDACMLETLLAFKRAGADGILTYCARDAAKLLSES